MSCGAVAIAIWTLGEGEGAGSINGWERQGGVGGDHSQCESWS